MQGRLQDFWLGGGTEVRCEEGYPTEVGYWERLSNHDDPMDRWCYIGYHILTSAKGLQQRPNICADFAQSHNIVFNSLKSQCLIVTSKRTPVRPPALYLNSVLLPLCDSYKYLGHIINSNLTDDSDIQKQTRSLYARVNVLKRWFSVASLDAKCMSFNAYCMPMYGSQLWNSAYEYKFKRLRLPIMLLLEFYWMYLDGPVLLYCLSHTVYLFTAVIRKSMFSL